MTSSATSRRAYIDWVRGLAVVIMVFAHTMDSWTRAADRDSVLYGLVVKIAGMGAPLFLFLAGIAVALGGGAKVRRGASVARAAADLRRRGLEIFALAFLFRLQAWFLSPGATLAGLFKVDILNVMGPSMMLGATLWSVSSRPWPRVVVLALAASACSFLTPVVRASDLMGHLPDVVEWYLRPPAGRSWFAFFPWGGLLLGGVIVGEVIDRARDAAAERRILRGLAVGGIGLFALAMIASTFPTPIGSTYFWTTGPSYFFARLGLMTLALPMAWLWTRRHSPVRFSPVLQLGRTSLFIYWIHVEMVYGFLSLPLHRALPIGGAFAAFVAFSGLMLWASVAKERIAARLQDANRPASALASRMAGSS